MIGVFALCVTIAILALALKPAAPTASAWTVVRVGHNTTLWDIASAHPVPGFTTAETVTLIRRHNDLELAGLSVGQKLLVPRSDQVTGSAVRD